MDTSEVLYTAADLIEERGWSTGSGWNVGPSDPLCIEGAISVASGFGESFELVWSCPAVEAVRAHVGTRHRLWTWNDHLVFMQDENEDILWGHWLGDGTEAEARLAARQRVIEVLRAAALLEAAREAELVEQSVVTA